MSKLSTEAVESAIKIDAESALMLVAARLRYIANSKWGTWKYLNMDLLKELDNTEGKE